MKTEDSFLSLGFGGENFYEFYDIDYKRVTEKPYNDDDTYFSAEIYIDQAVMAHNRTVYGFLELFGDVGGEI